MSCGTMPSSPATPALTSSSGTARARAADASGRGAARRRSPSRSPRSSRTARRPACSTTIPSGWRNNPSMMQQVRYTHRGEEVIARLPAHGATAASPTRSTDNAARRASSGRDDGQIELEIDGVQRTLSVTSDGAQPLGAERGRRSRAGRDPALPAARSRSSVAGGYAAPMPGKIVAVNVEARPAGQRRPGADRRWKR